MASSPLDQFLFEVKNFFRSNNNALEKIEINTRPSQIQQNIGPDLLFFDAALPINTTFSPGRKFLVFIGVTVSATANPPIDPRIFAGRTIQIAFGSDQVENRISVQPGDIVRIPQTEGSPTQVTVITNGIIGPGFRVTFLQTDNPDDVFVSPVPFADEDGNIQRAKLKVTTKRLMVDALLVTGSDVIGKVRLVDAAGDESDIGTGGGDGGSASVLGLQVYNRGHIFNGSTWDRQRGDTAGTWIKHAGGKSVLRAALNFNTSGDNTLLSAAGSGIKIKVLGIFLYAAAAVTIKLTNGAAGSSLLGPANLTPGAGGGFVLNVQPPDLHWLETGANTALVANLTAGIQVGGLIVYLTEA